MLINVGKYKHEEFLTRHYDFVLDLPFMMIGKEKIIFKEPIKIASKVTFTQEEVLVEGIITGRALLMCNCCLESFILDIETFLEEKFITNAQYNLISEQGQTEEEINFYQNDKINLEPFVEQAIYLALPMKIVCKKDCLGLCSECGCNLNLDKCKCEREIIDPRLAVLQQLLNKD